MTTMTAAQLRAQTGGMEPDPEVPERPRPPRQYPAAYKLGVLAEYERLDKAGKGALLRREGLYTSLLSEWRKQRERGALKALGEGARRGRPPVDPLKRDNARLRAENARLRDQLARQARVLEAQGNPPRCFPGSRPAAPSPSTSPSPASRPTRPPRRAGRGRGDHHHHPGADRGHHRGLPGAWVAAFELVPDPSPLAGAATPTPPAAKAPATRPGAG